MDANFLLKHRSHETRSLNFFCLFSEVLICRRCHISGATSSLCYFAFAELFPHLSRWYLTRQNFRSCWLSLWYYDWFNFYTAVWRVLTSPPPHAMQRRNYCSTSKEGGYRTNTWALSLHPLTHSLTPPSGRRSDFPDGWGKEHLKSTRPCLPRVKSWHQKLHRPGLSLSCSLGLYALMLGALCPSVSCPKQFFSSPGDPPAFSSLSARDW